MKLGEAVARLHRPTRQYLATRAVLPRLARDPESRLCGIRDVVLWMLPDYLPDPRMGAVECRRIEVIEAANRFEWFSRYNHSGFGVDESAIFMDFATGLALVPGYFSWSVKFVHDYVLLMIRLRFTENIYAFTMDGQLLAAAQSARYLGYGRIACLDSTIFHPTCLKFEARVPEDRSIIVTPCGIRLNSYAHAVCSWENSGEYATVTNFSTVKLYDDYGEEYGIVDLYYGATAQFHHFM